MIYAAQRPDGIVKIGYTDSLTYRISGLQAKSGITLLLGFRPGSWDEEMAIHARLAEFRAFGSEWYLPTPEVIAEADAIREGLPSNQLENPLPRPVQIADLMTAAAVRKSLGFGWRFTEKAGEIAANMRYGVVQFTTGKPNPYFMRVLPEGMPEVYANLRRFR